MGKFGFKLCQTLKKLPGQISRSIVAIPWAHWNTVCMCDSHASERLQHKLCSCKSMFPLKLTHLTRSVHMPLHAEKGVIKKRRNMKGIQKLSSELYT